MAQTLLDFDYNKAALGATLGYVDSDGTTHLATYVECTVDDQFLGGYISFDGITKYNFTKDGTVYTASRTGNNTVICTLSIISTDITKTTGTRIARVTDSDGTSSAKPATSFSSDDTTDTTDAKANTMLGTTTTTTTTEEIFSIATLQPREEIAIHCLQAMIPQYSYPLNFDNTKIKQLVDKAFLFAQEFINQAVLYREKETTSSTVESSEYTSVDSDSLNSDTDKLLYNICSSLNNLIAQNKNQYADQQKNGLNVLAALRGGTINTKVSGSIDANVSGSITTTEDTSAAATSDSDTTT